MGKAWETVGDGGADLDLTWQPYERQDNGFGVGRLQWAEGWDRYKVCVPDPKATDAPGGTWRKVGLLETDHRWEDRHRRRRRGVRLLRKAGYVARRRWPRTKRGLRQVGCNVVDDIVYNDGPAVGCQAVDPWDIAERLNGCGAEWYVQPRWRKGADEVGSFVAIPQPVLCGQAHVCPVCAELRSRTLARSLRAVIREDSNGRSVLFVTLTQRASPGEDLQGALGRWRSAWQRMTRGRPGERWAALQDGYYYGIEVTRGDGANERNPGPWWHVHAHALILLTPGHDRAGAARQLATEWSAATEGAAIVRELAGHGWEPLAGVQGIAAEPVVGWERRSKNGRSVWVEPASDARERIAAGDYRGPWCQELDLTDPDLPDVYQAAKYVTPVVDLHPVPLAEFVAVAHGRRWHQGGGEWRGVRKRAEELEAEGAADDDDSGRMDLGANIGRAGPGMLPRLDTLAPRMGIGGATVGAPRVPQVWFRLADSEAAEEAGWALESVGAARLVLRHGHRWTVERRGETLTRVKVPEDQWWLCVPSEIARERLDESLDELRKAQPRGSGSGSGDDDAPSLFGVLARSFGSGSDGALLTAEACEGAAGSG